MVIVRDPEEGWVNLGCYRAMIQSRDRISLWINPQKHGRILAQKYWKQGRAFGTSEYDLASAIAAATGSFVNRNSTTSTGPEAVICIQRIYYRDDPITTLAGTMFRSM
jgi:3-polyprenyl-4-hydroxybenzoate decarboxylase